MIESGYDNNYFQITKELLGGITDMDLAWRAKEEINKQVSKLKGSIRV